MTDLPTLPSLDYTSEESIQQTADLRASVALHASDSPLYFKGLKLRLTVSIKSLFFMLQRLDGVAETAGERHERDTIILLYLCSQEAFKWSCPVTLAGKTYQPLRSRPSDWLAVIDQWADDTFSCADLADAVDVIDSLWDINHATRSVVDSENAEVPEQKKTLNPVGKSD